MTSSIHQPHHKLVIQVLSDLDEARNFLCDYLSAEVVAQFDWSTLALVGTKFIDEEFQKNEADILYEIKPQKSIGSETESTEETAYLYLLFEHQSSPDKWMRRRLIRYMDRIWDKSFKDHPEQKQLRPILPVVFYQGEQPWNYPTDFTELFPRYAADWGFVPRFTHFLIDQSGISPNEVKGGLKAKVMQLLMLAAFHQPMEQALRLAAELIPQLPQSKGVDFVRVFIVYLLTTQEQTTVKEFAQAMKEQSANIAGNEIMSYAEELLLEGEIKGKIEAKIEAKKAEGSWGIF